MSEATESNDDPIGPRHFAKLQRLLFRDILLHAVGIGQLDLAEKSDEEALAAANAYVRAALEQMSSPEWKSSWILDHRPGLLERARTFAEEGDVEIAALCYATWVEHWANNLVLAILQRRKLDPKVCEQIVRDTNLKPKLSWLLQLLGLPPLAAEDRIACERIAEFRNGFVHYKWKAKPGDELLAADLRAALDAISAAVPRLLGYESMVLHGDASFTADSEARVQRVVDLMCTPFEDSE